MSSIVAWLDFSAEHQQSVYESIKAFESKDTVDDLGFGTIRDAISGALFPGTSVLQTRARYFLFIPWIFQAAQKKSSQDVVQRARVLELKLIGALEESDDTSGVIGIQRKLALKTVPSSIYWSGLQKFGIFKLRGRSIQQFGKLVAKSREDIEYEGEFVGGGSPFWCDMPPPPTDFKDMKFAELRLTQIEANWLSEQIISTSSVEHPNLLSALAKMLLKNDVGFLDNKIDFVWNLDLPDDADARLRELIRHSQFFSLLAQGASLIYNAMLIEKLQSHGREISFSTDYDNRLLEWARRASKVELSTWCEKVDEFWGCLESLGIDASEKARGFVNGLAAMVVQHGLDGFCSNPEVRELIYQRESKHKKHQARLTNKDRLFAYQGEAGTGLMTFRWDSVKRLLNDIADGRSQGGN
jgi:hypothetical protein